MIKANAELTHFFHSKHFVVEKIPCCDVQIWLLPSSCCSYRLWAFCRLWALQGQVVTHAGCCRLLQELFHFPFFSTRFRLEPSLAADHDWGSPERSAWCCTLYRWTSSTAQLSCILQPKNTNSSSFLAVGLYVLHHMAYHEHFGKLITFHCAKHTHYLASLSVPSV